MNTYKLHFFLGILLLLMSFWCCAQPIHGILLSGQDKTPVPYANVLDLDGTIRTSSDQHGKFTLHLSPEALNHRILVSSLGYRDTIFNAGLLANIQNPEIILRVQPWALPVVEITSSFRKKKNIFEYGDTAISLMRNSKGEVSTVPVLMTGGTSPLYLGVMIHPSRSHRGGTLTSLSVYVTAKEFPTNPFTIRLLACPAGMRSNKGELTTLFHDMNTAPIHVSAKQPGWMEVDLRPYHIVVPNTSFMVMFLPIEESSGTATGKDKKSVELGQYADKVPNVYQAIRFEDVYLFHGDKRQRIKLAVVVRGEK